MIDIVTIILVSSLSAIVIAFLIDNIRLRLRRKELMRSIVKLTMEKMILEDNMPNIPSETEGFIKFLSESREWAFSYIEDVQAAISNLEQAMVSDDKEKITEAYNSVVSFLPKNESND